MIIIGNHSKYINQSIYALYFQGKWIIIRLLKSAVPLLITQNPLNRIPQQSPVDEIMIFPILELGLTQHSNHPSLLKIYK